MEENNLNKEDGITKEKKWISISERLPITTFDFNTMYETQEISKKVIVLTDIKAGWEDNGTGEYLKEAIELEAYYIQRSMLGGSITKCWSLSDTGTDSYCKLEAVSHWREIT